MLEQMLLHPVEDFRRTFDVRLGTADVEVCLAGGDLHSQRAAQQAQVTVCRAEKLKLPAGIQLYGYFQDFFSLQ